MDRTLQERVPCWLGLFAGHGPRSAGACRSLCVEAEFRHRGQPGHFARTCPLNRQGTADAAHPHACFSKGYSSTAPCTPLQHLWGSKTHKQACLHTRTHVHAHTRTHACARAHKYKHKHAHMHAHKHTGAAHTHTRARAQTHRHTREHTYIRTNTLAHTHAHTHIHTRACVHTHLHAHMHMHAHVLRVMGFANVLASLATHPHLSSQAFILKQG